MSLKEYILETGNDMRSHNKLGIDLSRAIFKYEQGVEDIFNKNTATNKENATLFKTVEKRLQKMKDDVDQAKADIMNMAKGRKD